MHTSALTMASSRCGGGRGRAQARGGPAHAAGEHHGARDCKHGCGTVKHGHGLWMAVAWHDLPLREHLRQDASLATSLCKLCLSGSPLPHEREGYSLRIFTLTNAHPALQSLHGNGHGGPCPRRGGHHSLAPQSSPSSNAPRPCPYVCGTTCMSRRAVHGGTCGRERGGYAR